MAVEKHITLAPDYSNRRSSEKIVPEGEAWLPDGVGDALNSEVLPARDELYGWGEAHQYGQIGECLLFLYPDHQTLVYEDPQLYVVIKKPSSVTLAGDAVFVDTPGETQTSFLAFNRDGGMKLRVKPKQLALDQLSAAEVASEPRRPQEDGSNPANGRQSSSDASDHSSESNLGRSTEPITKTLVSESVAPWEVEGDTNVTRNDHELNGGDTENRSKSVVESKSPVSAPSVEPTKQKAKRVDLKAARLGRPIICRETKNGKTITKFPVAEHSKDSEGSDVTAWHTVMAFNALADRLCREFDAGEIAVGDELKVAGYPQIQVIPDRNGELKQHEVVFAAHVGKAKQKGGQ